MMNTKLAILISLFLLCFSSKSQVMTTIAGTGNFPDAGDSGLAILANIDGPTDVKLDKKGNIFISEQFYGIRKIDKAGIIISPGPVYGFESFIIDSIGNIFFPGGNLVAKVDTFYKVTIVAGGGTLISNGIPANQALLNKTGCVAIDPKGNLYIGDDFRISKVDLTGKINTITGAYGIQGYSGDNGLAINAYISFPQCMVFDKKGNLYIADMGNNIIRKIDTSGIISTFAGTGNPGFSGDGGLAINATFLQPHGLAFDSYGNLYISDMINNRIRKVDTAGIITTYAGSKWAGNSDGPALQASLYYPDGLAIDSANNLYIADFGNNLIRKVTPPVLPVVIKNYEIRNNNGIQNTVENVWETVSEVNVSHFNVQRSIDGVSFETVGTVKAKGAGKYSYTAPPPPKGGIEYFRLEVVDKNGALSYSEIRQLIIENGKLIISPNPGKDFISISGGSIKEVRISDASGRVLLTSKDKKIDIRSLVSGVYYIAIETINGNHVIQKFIKLF